MPKFKSVVDSFIEFFTAEEKKFEYELLPTEVEKKVQESIPTVVQESAKPTLLLRAAEPSPVKAAEEIVEPSPVKGPIFEANKALEESQERLNFLQDQAVLAAEEAAILDKVREVNGLIRKAAIEMGEQRLLPRDMQQRREAAALDSNDILEMFNDLGF